MKSYNIGLLTFHKTTNFGSLLQTIGLYEKLKNFNFNVEIIDYCPPAISNREFITFAKPINIKNLVKFLLYYRKRRWFLHYIYHEFNLSDKINVNEISATTSKYDILISGSDILWGKDITNCDYTYFLDFANKKQKCYSFASSVGAYELWDDDERISELLKNFDQITVREGETKKWLKNKFDINSDFVCDPTMLLTSDEWLNLFPVNRTNKRNYVLVYFDNENGKCLNDAITFARKNKKKVYFINYGMTRKGVKNIKPSSINDFLSLIYNADYVFTSSYHGILFSVYFNKQFFYYERQHKSRVVSLANVLNIANRCYNKKNIEEAAFNDLNYEHINKLVSKFRDESIKILEGMIFDERNTNNK